MRTVGLTMQLNVVSFQLTLHEPRAAATAAPSSDTYTNATSTKCTDGINNIHTAYENHGAQKKIQRNALGTSGGL